MILYSILPLCYQEPAVNRGSKPQGPVMNMTGWCGFVPSSLQMGKPCWLIPTWLCLFFFGIFVLHICMLCMYAKWNISHSVVSNSCNPMNYSPPGSSAHGILQTAILEWVTLPFSKGFSQPRDRTQVSHIAGRFFTIWATREAGMCVCVCVCVCIPLPICEVGRNVSLSHSSVVFPFLHQEI